MHSIQGSPAGPAATQRPPGGFTVLVVDDEEAVRRLACRMLTWTGYQAMEATHGRVALAATLFAVALRRLQRDVDDRDGLVDHDDRARPEHRARLGHRVEVVGQV